MKNYLENKKRSLKFIGYSDEDVSKIVSQLEHILKTEDSLSKDEAMIFANRIYPVMTNTLKIGVGKPSGNRFWIDSALVYHESFIYTHPLDNFLPAVDLMEIGEITTYHRCHHQKLLNPTIYEVLCQIPPELRFDVCAFELYVENPGKVYSYPLDRHILKCILYSGTVPEEILKKDAHW